ncbi:MAG: hypothetical protein R6V49_00930, partial [Bacteroidales bacterium]
MKTLIRLLIPSVLLFFASCSSTHMMSGGDDVYYSPKQSNGTIAADQNAADQGQNYQVTSQSKSTTEYTTVYTDDPEDSVTSEYYVDDQGNTYITNNYYGEYNDYDDYYDYAYTSRIRRFHSSYYTGFG